MRLKLTFFLCLLNVVLFAYLFYLESGDSRSRAESSGRLILPAGLIEQATGLALSGERASQPWSLSREDRRWQVETPVSWPANPYAVRRLIDLLAFLQWETRFSVQALAGSGKSLADYGLQEGAAELAITTPDQTVRLRVGAPTEIGYRVYVLSPDQQEVYVVERSLLEGMSLNADSLIDRTVIEIPTFEVESINLNIGSNNAVRVQMARTRDRWVFHAPVRAAADSAKVNATLDTLQRLEVIDFTHLSPGATGLANPSLRLNVNGNGRQQTLFLGNLVDPNAYPVLRYARLEAQSTIFTLPAEPFEVWFTAQESLRQRQFMDFPPGTVGSLEIRLGNRAITLQLLESGSWQVVQTIDGNLTTATAEEAVVSDLINRLATLEALRFVSDAPSAADLERYGFNDPQRQITVRMQNGESRTLLLGDFVFEGADNTSQNRLYAKREAQSPVYLTTASILAQVPLNNLHYRQRVAGSLSAGAIISKVRIRDLVEDRVVLEVQQDPDQGWDPTFATLEDQAEAAAARKLVQIFRRFPVKQFLADTFSDPLELDSQRTLPWRFVLEAEIQLPGGNREAPEIRRYRLTERVGGTTQYGGSEALDLTFELPQELIDTLHPILFDRPRPDAETNLEPVIPAEAEPLTRPETVPDAHPAESSPSEF